MPTKKRCILNKMNAYIPITMAGGSTDARLGASGNHLCGDCRLVFKSCRFEVVPYMYAALRDCWQSCPPS